MKRIILSSLLALLEASLLRGADLHVPAEHATIQAAIDFASNGDTVLVAPGTYEGVRPIVFGGKGVTLKSCEGPEKTILRMGVPVDPARASIVAFEQAEPGNASLEGFTLESGRGTHRPVVQSPGLAPGLYSTGGAVLVGSHSAPRITGNVLRNNQAEVGGAIYCDVDSSPILSANKFLGNATPAGKRELSARGGALACASDSIVLVQGGIFSDSRAYDGGAIYAGFDSFLEIRSVQFERNQADDDGGAILFHGRTLSIAASSFRSNRSNDRGGAVIARNVLFDRPTFVTIVDSLFEAGSARDGGGIVLECQKRLQGPQDPALVVRRCQFLGNTASYSGGAITNGYESGNLLVDGCRIEGNRASIGGGIFLSYESVSTIERSILFRNHAIAGGGLLAMELGNLLISGCTIQANTAGLGGGGLYFSRNGGGSHLLRRCTIEGNAGGAQAGGIHSDSPQALQLESCIVWGNSGGSFSGILLAIFSCIEGPEFVPGAGNINADPRFAGWSGVPDVHVDPANPLAGDGTPQNPFRDLGDAFQGYSLELLPSSPCIAKGMSGVDMGAETGRAPVAGLTERRIHLADGRHAMVGLSLAEGVSILGSGPIGTRLDGPILGLRTGRSLSGAACSGGVPAVVVVASGEAPLIESCVLTGAVQREVPIFGIPNDYTSGGWGIVCAPSSSPVLDHCTITSNTAGPTGFTGDCVASTGAAGSGIYSLGATPHLESCIVWGNAGGSIFGSAEAFRSAIEGSRLWPGEGNIRTDPQLAGWRSSDVFVDSAAVEPGDGTSQRPFRELPPAFADRSVALTSSSPCIGTGVGGTNMGADVGVVNAPPARSLLVHVAAGTYKLEGLSFSSQISLEGAGEDRTVLDGQVLGLRTGAQLSRVTVAGYTIGAGIGVSPCESPEIRSVTVHSSQFGIHSDRGSPRIAETRLTRNTVGISLLGAGSATIDRCLLVGNYLGIQAYTASPRVTSSVFAGSYFAVAVASASHVSLINCTIAQNRGLYSCDVATSTVEIHNGLLWDNADGSLGCGPITSTMANRDPHFVRNGAYDFNRYTNVIKPADYTVSLPDFIVTEGDYHLRPGSPAIDGASLLRAPPDDLDGDARPCGAGVDHGADELGDCERTITFRRGDSNADGKTDIADAIHGLSYLFTGGAAPACEKTADVNDSGKIDLTDAVALLGHLFQGLAPPSPPFPGCGQDPTGDLLPCVAYDSCNP